MMIKHLRDLLRSFWKEHASKQIKLKKSKQLLIYDEYLNKYVSADELLIPGTKAKNKEAATLSKSKELFVFDVLFKKFVNPKLDLLLPNGIKSVDFLIKKSTNNKTEETKNASGNYFWGKKASKKHAVLPLLPTHSRNCRETESVQAGWAGQMTRKPDTDPRPELGKPECMLGPGKAPNKKKPLKKKSTKNKQYLVCSKVPKKNMEAVINERDAKEISKGNLKGSKEGMSVEVNCYSDLKEGVKSLKSQDSTKDVSKTPLPSIVKQEVRLEDLIKKPEENIANKSDTFKIVCSNISSNEVNEKVPIAKESMPNSPNKINIYDIKVNTPLNKSEKNKSPLKKSCENKNGTNHGSELKNNNQSKSVLCQTQLPSSLVPSKDSKTITNLYLCKEQKYLPKNKNDSCNTEKSVCINNTNVCLKEVKDDVCCKSKSAEDIININQIKKERKTPPKNILNTSLVIETPDSSTEHSNKIKCTKEETMLDTSNKASTCFHKAKVDDGCKYKSLEDPGLEELKHECNKTITKRLNISPIETLDSSKEKYEKTIKNLQGNVKKSKTPSCMEKPNTVDLKSTCSKTSSLIAPGQSRSDRNCNRPNVCARKDKIDNGSKEPCECSSLENSKANENCNEINDPEKHKSQVSSKCLNIELKSTEKLQRIAQEELFKKADLSTDLTKCSSYLGFKVKKPTLKTEPEQSCLEDHKDVCTKKIPKEVLCKKKQKSKKALKTTKSHDDIIQTKKDCSCNNFIGSKSESLLNDGNTQRMLNLSCEDLKVLNVKSPLKDSVSLPDVKQESASKSPDSKCDLQDRKNKLLKKKSSTKTKTSKKSKSKSVDFKSDSLKSKKDGKKKSTKRPISKHNNNKQPCEKLTTSIKQSVSCECKDQKKNINDDMGKIGRPCMTDQTSNGQDEQVCCKKPERENEKHCCEKSPTDESVQCSPAQEKTKQSTTNKSNIEKNKPDDCKENKKNKNPKDYIKHIITGSMPRKRTNLFKICKPVNSIPSLNSQGKSNKTKMINTPPKTSLKKKESLVKMKVSKSAHKCSEKKSSLDKSSKPSKSKHSICSKTSKVNISKSIIQQNEHQTGDKLTKLNNLVSRAKCKTSSRNSKPKIVTHALICSKSTPSLQSAKAKKISGVSKLNKVTAKKPSTSNTYNKHSKLVNGTKNGTRNTKMCSLHTLRNIMVESPIIKKAKGTDVKSFSELKTTPNTPERNISAEQLNSRNCPIQLDLQLNNQKTGKINLKTTGVAKDRKDLLEDSHQTEQNSLKTCKVDWWKRALIDPKNKQNSPSFSSDKYFRLFITSMIQKNNVNKLGLNDAFKVGTNTNTDDQFTSSKNGQDKLITKSPNNIKEYCNNGFNILEGKNNCEKTAILHVVKDKSNNVDKNIKLNIQTKFARPHEKETTTPNKVTHIGNQDNDQLGEGRLILGGVTRNLIKSFDKEIYFTKGVCKGVLENQSHHETESKDQLKARDTFNLAITLDKKTVRSKSAASTNNFNNALNAPHKSLSPCKTKSFSSLNAVELQKRVAKHLLRPFRPPKKKIDVKVVANTQGEEQNSFHTNKILYSQKIKIPDKSQEQLTKCENSANSSIDKIPNVLNKSSCYHELTIPRKFPQLKLKERKLPNQKCDEIGQINGRRQNVSNETILCDFIEDSSGVSILDIKTQYSNINNKYIKNQHGHFTKLTNKNDIQILDQKNKTKLFVNEVKHKLNYKEGSKRESNKFSRSVVENKLDEVEKQETKLETTEPLMKRILKIGNVSVNVNQELNKKLASPKSADNIKDKGPELVKKSVNENIGQTMRKVLDENAISKKNSSTNNNFTTSNDANKSSKTTFNNCLKSAIGSDFTKIQDIKLKNKMQLIGKRHRKFTDINYKKTNPSLDEEIDLSRSENPVTKETTKTRSEMPNNKNKQHDDSSAYLNSVASLSSKESRLLMEQSFFKKSKPEYSTGGTLRTSKSESSLIATDKHKSKVISSSKQQKLPMEQPFSEQLKLKPSSDSVCNLSKSEPSLITSKKYIAKANPSRKQPVKQVSLLMEEHFYKKPKSEYSTYNKQHSSKSESSFFASNKANTKDSSSTNQPSRQLRLLMEQPFYKNQTFNSHTKKSNNSKLKNNLPQANDITEKELHSSKSESNLDAPKTIKTSVASPRKQQNSIRSQLQRQIPMKAVIKEHSKITDIE